MAKEYLRTHYCLNGIFLPWHVFHTATICYVYICFIWGFCAFKEITPVGGKILYHAWTSQLTNQTGSKAKKSRARHYLDTNLHVCTHDPLTQNTHAGINKRDCGENDSNPDANSLNRLQPQRCYFLRFMCNFRISQPLCRSQRGKSLERLIRNKNTCLHIMLTLSFRFFFCFFF